MLRSPVVVAVAASALAVLGLAVAVSRGPSAEASQVITAGDLPARPAPVAGGTTVVPTSVSYAGRPRTVVLHVPDGLLAPAPLVVALHAHSQTTDAVRSYSRLERLADEQGFVVAFPSGAGGSWNAGTCCDPARAERVDDVAFLDEVLRVVRERVAIDPARISVTGSSNGGMMALRYACERPAVVASAAVVAGPLVATCAPAEPVPVLALHGALDTSVPLAGGSNAALRTTFPALDDSLAPFRSAGAPVDVRVVGTAGHTWMTAYDHGVDATRVAWEWMRDHPRPLAPG